MRMDLDSLYEAICDEDAFSTLAPRIAQAMGTRSAIFAHFDPFGTPITYQASYWSESFLLDYETSFSNSDPWKNVAFDLGFFDKALAVDALITPEQFTQTSIYNDLHRYHGDDTGRCMGVMPSFGNGMPMIAVHRAINDAAFTREDELRLDNIYEHLGRIVRLRRTLQQERLRGNQLQDLADYAESPILRLDPNLKVVRISASASRLLASGDGLGIRHGYLTVPGTLDARLRRALAAVINRSAAAEIGFLCPRPSGRRSYRIIVLPAGIDGTDGAIIKINDPEMLPPGSALKAMRDAYGLTATELALVRHLLAEHSTEEIATSRNVSRETIKTQIKSLFLKVGVNRQSALIKLLATFPHTG